MILQRINYQGFRNLADAELSFSDDFNFIIGDNGTGKTNLLEAVFYVGLASSFRASEEKNLIRKDNDFLRINAEADGKEAVVYLDSNKKKLMIQGNEVQRLSDFVGWLGITLLSIEDIWIVRGSPAKRRSFLNWALAKISSAYCANLIEYGKIVRQRNRLLQSINENGDAQLLEIYDEQLVTKANEIYKEREHYLPELKKQVRLLGSMFGLENLTIEYQSTCANMNLTIEGLNEVRMIETRAGCTVIGPHRDDLLFGLNGRPLRDFASEGEERAASIAIKLAESELLYEKSGQRPILLLDEVAAELDQTKREILLNSLRGQVFYASTQLPQFKNMKEKKYTIFQVQRGVFEISAKN